MKRRDFVIGGIAAGTAAAVGSNALAESILGKARLSGLPFTRVYEVLRIVAVTSLRGLAADDSWLFFRWLDNGLGGYSPAASSYIPAPDIDRLKVVERGDGGRRDGTRDGLERARAWIVLYGLPIVFTEREDGLFEVDSQKIMNFGLLFGYPKKLGGFVLPKVEKVNGQWDSVCTVTRGSVAALVGRASAVADANIKRATEGVRYSIWDESKELS